MKIAIVGVTGLVGQTFCRVLEERNFPVDNFLPVASEMSVGQPVVFRNREHKIIGLENALRQKPDIAFFSAGKEVSLEWAPQFKAAGTVVIDNSSAWRMEKEVPLVVPEVNGQALGKSDKLIANPNCSTIQMVVVLHPLHREHVIERIVVSTYQSVTGTGGAAVMQLDNERMGVAGEKAYPHPIDLNCLPHCDTFEENGYTKEEMKLVNETRKIMDAPALPITATAVRVPVVGGHSESVNVSFKKDFELDQVRNLLQETPGITVQDDPAGNLYPMPLTARNSDTVFVGRIRRDASHPRALNLWIVSDNLRKGAATNAVQIAEYLLDRGRTG